VTAQDDTAGRPLHRLLAQQLRRLGLDPSRPPAAQQWHRLLAAISDTYVRWVPDTAARTGTAAADPGPPAAACPGAGAPAHLHALVQTLPDLILLFDEDGRCFDILPQQGPGEASGPRLSAAAVRDRLLTAGESGGQTVTFRQAVQASLATNTIQVLEYDLDPARDARVFEARVIPAGLMLSGQRRVIVLARDITDSVQSRRRLEHHATHDALTGLANRRLLEQRLAESVARAGHTGTFGAVVLLDLDGFKHINDQLGHAAGDRVLQAAASRLRAATRRQDLVARLGGDEFVLVLEDLPEAQDAAAIAQQILDVLAEPFVLAESQSGVPTEVPNCARLTASMGIAVFPRDGDDAAALLHRADAAMYAAKRTR
jgi:diguanylate cyclase (GGDEF)-like protein